MKPTCFQDSRKGLCKPVLWLSKWFAAIGNILPFLPIDSDRFKMLTQDNVCNASAFYKDLKIKPVFFKDILSRELNDITGGKDE